MPLAGQKAQGQKSEHTSKSLCTPKIDRRQEPNVLLARSTTALVIGLRLPNTDSGPVRDSLFFAFQHAHVHRVLQRQHGTLAFCRNVAMRQ
jgi:hypothetical protein